MSISLTHTDIKVLFLLAFKKEQKQVMGRGSAVDFVVVAVVAAMVVASHFPAAEAATTYTVGGPGGWTYNVVSWPNGKRFRAGDTLVFNYDKSFHNVVRVDRVGYSRCSVSRGAKVYRTGRDQISLVRGQNFFICSLPGHCQSNMKIAVNAF